MQKLGWQSALVALPFAHLLLASAYLYAYCVGFGSTVATFVSAGDVFTTSIRNLAPMYVFAGATVLFSSRQEIGRWLTHPNPRPEQYGPYNKSPSFKSRPISFLKFLLLIAIVIAVIPTYLEGERIDILMIVCGAGSVFLVGDWIFNMKNTHEVNAALAGFLALIGAITFGLNSGQKDRHASYMEQVRGNATCGDYVVLRHLADNYLAVGKDNRHRLINSDCKVKFTIPAVKPQVDASVLPPVIKWLFWPV